ncbi:MAG: hypothetical protein IPN19_14620 [Elusimicrobia bacterium]|nr:hypothetical protein [Elusimicrobiota bacterium]
MKRYFQDKKREGINSWALNYGITDLIVRYQLAASKMAIFTALKNNVSVSGVSRDQIQDAVVRPEGPLMQWGNTRIQEREKAGEILPEFTTTASVLAFAATLDGLIENLQHVAFHFGEKKGPDIAHLVGVFGLMEICMTASMVQSNSNHHLISAGVLQDQIVKRVYYPRNVYSAAYAAEPDPKAIIFQALLTGDLNTYEKLLALLEKIRDENLYTPAERFYSLKARWPRSSERRDLQTAYPIVLAGGITGNTPDDRYARRKKEVSIDGRNRKSLFKE